MAAPRVVLDTDVVVAGFASPTGASRRWMDAAIDGRIVLVGSLPLALEYEAVLTRPEHLERARATERQARDFLRSLLRSAVEAREGYLLRNVLRDKDDAMVLETAVNGGAEWIVTFNLRDFAAAAHFGISVGRPGPVWNIAMERR